jgi:hypothetical protein
MKKLLPLLCIVALTLLSGCATGASFAETKASIPPLAADKGRIFFYRPSALGAAIQPAVKLDGNEVGTAKSHGFFFVDVAPGSHVASTTTEVKRDLSLTLAANQTRYVRLAMSMGFLVGHIYPELVDNAVGEKEIAECKAIAK